MDPFSVIMSQVRFELTTYGLEDRCSIQLSHCDITRIIIVKGHIRCQCKFEKKPKKKVHFIKSEPSLIIIY